MQTRKDIYEIKGALKRQIAEALNEAYSSIEIEFSEVNIDDAYAVKGTFKVVPFLATTDKRKGKLEAKLDDNLQILSLKITEDQQ
jgi:hypothetical protein